MIGRLDDAADLLEGSKGTIVEPMGNGQSRDSPPDQP